MKIVVLAGGISTEREVSHRIRHHGLSGAQGTGTSGDFAGCVFRERRYPSGGGVRLRV